MEENRVFLKSNEENESRENKMGHISWAYMELDEVPPNILTDPGLELITLLDLSYNNFKNLSFLKFFTKLQVLVLDRNVSLDLRTFPVMANLEILWLNNCNLINIQEWFNELQLNCPNLTQLSMMCNPVGPTLLNGVTKAEEKEYHRQVAEMFPKLQYFDGIATKLRDRPNNKNAIKRAWAVLCPYRTKRSRCFEYLRLKKIFSRSEPQLPTQHRRETI